MRKSDFDFCSDTISIKVISTKNYEKNFKNITGSGGAFSVVEWDTNQLFYCLALVVFY